METKEGKPVARTSNGRVRSGSHQGRRGLGRDPKVVTGPSDLKSATGVVGDKLKVSLCSTGISFPLNGFIDTTQMIDPFVPLRS